MPEGRLRIHSYAEPRLLTATVGLGILALLPVLVVDVWSIARLSWSAVLPLGVVGVISTVMIVVEASRGLMLLNLTHWVFIYIFMFLAPLAQYSIGAFPWGSFSVREYGTLEATNLVLLIWTLSWLLGRVLGTTGKTLRLDRIRVTRRRVDGTIMLAVIGAGLLVSLVGVDGLLLRGAYDLSQTIDSSSLFQIADKLFRGLPVAAAAGYVVTVREGWYPVGVRILLGLLAAALLLLTNFPLGAARYWIASVYLGFLFSVIPAGRWSGWLLVFALVGGLLVVFPILDSTRSTHSLGQFLASFDRVPSPRELLITGHFDAYSQLARTWRYVAEGPGIAYGRQLLGAVLFWVPRSWWPGKPIGSGDVVALNESFSFTNLSSPLPAEGFIDFGWLGVVLFGLIGGWAFTAVDRAAVASSARNALINTIYPFWVGFAFFLMRGELMSSLAYAVGFTVAFVPLGKWPISLAARRNKSGP